MIDEQYVQNPRYHQLDPINGTMCLFRSAATLLRPRNDRLVRLPGVSRPFQRSDNLSTCLAAVTEHGLILQVNLMNNMAEEKHDLEWRKNSTDEHRTWGEGAKLRVGLALSAVG